MLRGAAGGDEAVVRLAHHCTRKDLK